MPAVSTAEGQSLHGIRVSALMCSHVTRGIEAPHHVGDKVPRDTEAVFRMADLRDVLPKPRHTHDHAPSEVTAVCGRHRGNSSRSDQHDWSARSKRGSRDLRDSVELRSCGAAELGRAASPPVPTLQH